MTDAPVWIEPQLKDTNVDFLLSSLRETHAAIDSLQQKKKKLIADLQKAYEKGHLDSFSIEGKDDSFKYDGVSFTLQKGKSKIVWDQEVKQQIERIEYNARRMGLYTESQGSPYWVTRIEKSL